MIPALRTACHIIGLIPLVLFFNLWCKATGVQVDDTIVLIHLVLVAIQAVCFVLWRVMAAPVAGKDN